MKVTESSNVAPLPTPPKAEPSATPTVATDRVSLAATSQIANAKADLQAKRASRLEELADQVRSGSYEVDVTEVASSVVDDSSLMSQVQAVLNGS